MVADLLVISIGAMLINNFVLVQFLGICPFLGVSKKVDTSVGMGFAVIFVMACAAIITWCVQYYLLVPFNLEYLQTIAFILVIAVLVQFVEMFLKKSIPLCTVPLACICLLLLRTVRFSVLHSRT